MKKIIAAISAIVLPCVIAASTLFSAYAYTCGDYEYTRSGGNATIVAYNGSAAALTIPSELDGYTVTGIDDQVFQNNAVLESVTVPTGVTAIGDKCFYSCTKLKTVNLPSGVTEIPERCFAYCGSLESVTASGILTKIYREAFNACSALQSFTFTGTLTYIGDNAFANCTALHTDLSSLPSSLTYIGSQAFRNCYTSCGNVNIGAGTTVGGLAFDACGVAAINFDNSHPKYSSVNGVVFNKDKTVLVRYPSGKTDVNYTVPATVTQLDAYAFHRALYLENVTIPSSVTTLGAYTFAACRKLNNVALPGSVTALPAYAFNSCSMLQHISLPSTLQSIGAHAFGYCDLREINLPASLRSIGKYAFYRNYHLEEVALPNGITQMDNYVFEHCEALRRVTLPSQLAALPRGTFAYCSALDEVVLPEGYTEIEDAAFTGCTSLHTIELPSTLTNVRKNAFLDAGLTDVYYNGTETAWNGVSISETGNLPLLNAMMHYLGGHVHSYTITDFQNGTAIFSCACGDGYGTLFSDYLNSREDEALDVNHDGIVNAKDYAILLKQFNN